MLRQTQFKMCIIFVLILFNSHRAVHCEWIEISQPIRRSNEFVSNRSLVLGNAEIPINFDYSTYKDFFSIMEPDIDFSNPIEPFHKNVVDKYAIKNNLMKKDFHILMDNSDNIPNVDKTVEFSNVSKISVFSGTRDQSFVNQLKVDPMLSLADINNSNESVKIQSEDIKIAVVDEMPLNKPIEGNEQRPKKQENRVILKRVEYKPFDFNGVLKFFANIQQSFPLNAFTGIREKIQYLENFKKDLIDNIGSLM